MTIYKNLNLHISQFSTDTVIFAEVFPDIKKGKSRDRARSILEAAIESYRVNGIENTTYERIAEIAGISRPLIFKYFADYDDIFYKSVKLIRVHFQLFAVDAIKKQNHPTEKVRAYVHSTFEWLEKFPSYASGLLLYLQRCSWSERERDLNTQFTEAGRSRIEALIRLGLETGEFSCADPLVMAKQVQTVITGAVVTQLTENLQNNGDYQNDVMALCLGLCGAKPSVE
jgi:AcrR family transcriptional regulator